MSFVNPSARLYPFYRLNKEYKKYAQMLQHTGKGVRANGNEACANKPGILCSSLLVYITSSDNGLSRGDTWCISMIYGQKHPKNSMTIVSNSSVGASKLVCEFGQAALGTQESSVVLMPPPILPCDPDDVEDKGAVKVCLKLLKVFYCSLSCAFCQDMTAPPSPTPSPESETHAHDHTPGTCISCIKLSCLKTSIYPMQYA